MDLGLGSKRLFVDGCLHATIVTFQCGMYVQYVRALEKDGHRSAFVLGTNFSTHSIPVASGKNYILSHC